MSKDSEGRDVKFETGIDYSKFLFKDKNGDVVNLLASDTKLINDPDKITTVTTVEMKEVTANLLRDDMTYTATITAHSKQTGNVAVLTINFTKALPTFPAVIVPFTGVLVDNNLKIYPVKAASGVAEYDLKNVWHGISEDYTAASKGYVNLTFSEIFAAPATKTISYVPATNMISAAAELVNPNKADNKNYGKKFPMSVEYSYGKISRILDNGVKVVDHKTSWGKDWFIRHFE